MGAETFLKELVWREFAYHLIYHTLYCSKSWREEWEVFLAQTQTTRCNRMETEELAFHSSMPMKCM